MINSILSPEFQRWLELRTKCEGRHRSINIDMCMVKGLPCSYQVCPLTVIDSDILNAIVHAKDVYHLECEYCGWEINYHEIIRAHQIPTKRKFWIKTEGSCPKCKGRVVVYTPKPGMDV